MGNTKASALFEVCMLLKLHVLLTIRSETNCAEDGYHGGHPKYTEQNKNDGTTFNSTLGAEIIYCSEIRSWVFRHKYIVTTPDEEREKENECSWLLRSPETQAYAFELINANSGA